jgi:hypothetical protein
MDMSRPRPQPRSQTDQTRLENDAVAAYGPDAEARPATDPETQMHDPGMVVESRNPLDSAQAGHDPAGVAGERWAAPRATAQDAQMPGRDDERGRRARGAIWMAGAIGLVLLALAVIMVGPLGMIVVVPVLLVILFLAFGSTGGPAAGA